MKARSINRCLCYDFNLYKNKKKNLSSEVDFLICFVVPDIFFVIPSKIVDGKRQLAISLSGKSECYKYLNCWDILRKE